MSVYLGHRGRVELRRDSGRGFLTTIASGSVNADTGRVQLIAESQDGVLMQVPLINGDEVEIRGPLNAAGNRVNLSFVAASGWPDNQKHATGKWFANVDELDGLRLYNTFDQSLAGDIGGRIPLEAIANDLVDVEFEVINSLSRILGRVSSWEINTKRENIDTTVLSDQFRSQWSGLMSGSGQLTAQWNYREDSEASNIEPSQYFLQLINRTEIGAQFRTQLFLKTPDIDNAVITGYDDAIWYDVTCVITQAGVQVSDNSLITMTADFVTTGPIRLLSSTISIDALLQENGDDILLDGNVFGRLLLE